MSDIQSAAKSSELSDSWVDQIVAAVALPLVCGDRQQLLDRISYAKTWYDTHRDLNARPARILKLEDSSKAVRKARERIAGVWDDIAEACAGTGPDVNDFLNELQTAIDGRLRSLRATDKPSDVASAKSIARELALNERSSFEMLCGHLDEIYNTFFGSEKKYSRGRKYKASGPRIRFIGGCLLELGVMKNGRAYSDESIAKAVQDKRSGRPRQSRRGAKKTNY